MRFAVCQWGQQEMVSNSEGDLFYGFIFPFKNYYLEMTKWFSGKCVSVFVSPSIKCNKNLK